MTDTAARTVASAPDSPAALQGAVAGSLVRNQRLQHLRGFAALLVLLFHAAEYVRQLRGDAFYTLVFSPFLGAYGVAVFFVLSGYLMERLSLRGSPYRFLLDRILRIYPLMLIVFALAVLGYWVTGFARRPDLISLTLVPAGPRNYFLGIEWTLLLEMTYYVIIAVAMMTGLRGRLSAAFAVWLAVLAGVALAGLGPKETSTPTLSTLFGQMANAAFLMGFLLPALLRWRLLPGPRVLCLGAVAVAIAIAFTPENAYRWVASLSALLLVAAALKAAPVASSSLWNVAWLRLGDASYALYLCHVPLIIISGNILPPGIPHWALLLGWCVCAVGLALLLGRLDLRLHERLKAWAATRSPRFIANAALGFIAAFLVVALVADIGARSARRAEDRARAVLTSATAQSWPSALAGIDSSLVLNDGRLILRGYGIDLAAPDDDAHVAVRQGGAVIGFDRMTRMRPQVAEAAGRKDLASIRFGFGVVTDDPLDCRAGPLTAAIILSNGKVVPIAGEVLAAVCKTAGERSP